MTAPRYRPPTRRADLGPALARLSTLVPLTAEDEVYVRGLDDWRADPPGVVLARNQRPPTPRLLIDGWAARVRLLDDGRRQIFNFILPGEFIGLPLRGRPGACITVSMTAVQTLDATPVWKGLVEGRLSPRLNQAVQLAASIEDVWLMDQVVRLGRHSAYERICHLVMELYQRAQAIGAASGNRMSFPLTQEMLADATGLSVVHVNRVLQQLRSEALVEIAHGHLTLMKPDALAMIGGGGSASAT
jgi:CRP-like cAMP-binding protein